MIILAKTTIFNLHEYFPKCLSRGGVVHKTGKDRQWIVEKLRVSSKMPIFMVN